MNFSLFFTFITLKFRLKVRDETVQKQVMRPNCHTVKQPEWYGIVLPIMVNKYEYSRV